MPDNKNLIYISVVAVIAIVAIAGMTVLSSKSRTKSTITQSYIEQSKTSQGIFSVPTTGEAKKRKRDREPEEEYSKLIHCYFKGAETPQVCYSKKQECEPSDPQAGIDHCSIQATRKGAGKLEWRSYCSDEVRTIWIPGISREEPVTFHCEGAEHYQCLKSKRNFKKWKKLLHKLTTEHEHIHELFDTGDGHDWVKDVRKTITWTDEDNPDHKEFMDEMNLLFSFRDTREKFLDILINCNYLPYCRDDFEELKENLVDKLEQAIQKKKKGIREYCEEDP